jgi:hypothetical protein
MSQSGRRAVIVAALLSAVIGIAVRAHGLAAAGEPEITPAIRAATLQFAPEVTPADQAWIRAAIASARPEARRLIDEVDGLVTVRTDLSGTDAIGLAESGPEGLSVSFDVAALNGDRAIDRGMVVLHELGHIIDFTLVDDELVHQLDAGIPPAGACESTADDFGACTAIEERFADTFAKWALRGRFSLAGSGYGIPTPPSLEDWGTPLARLAYEVDIKARQG